MRDDRLNLLLIMTDQQSADMLRSAGNRELTTPGMDWLARHGVRFERAYCAHPICVPSRSSMMTGRMPHEIGVDCNIDAHRIPAASMGRLIRESGYATTYLGKWHVPMPASDLAWHGFDRMQFAEGKGHDMAVGEAAEAFFRQPQQEPFFLTASFTNPHNICQWARGEPLPDTWLPDPPLAGLPSLPANFEVPADEPEVIRELQRSHYRTYPSVDWSAAAWQRYRWAYARLVEAVDRQISRVLAALQASGLAERTLIVFLSDHGDGNATHRWNQKTLFYESVARVPLIVVDPCVPGRAGAVDATHLVSTGLDLLPTLCDYAGALRPLGLVGRSLRPLVQAGAVPEGETPWRSHVVAETSLAPHYGINAHVLGRMVRSARYKYVLFNQGRVREQLFDLQEDPGEMRNLVGSGMHAGVLQQHRQWLDAWCRQTRDAITAVPGVARDGWMLAAAE